MTQEIVNKIVTNMVSVAQLTGIGTQEWSNKLEAYRFLFDSDEEWFGVCYNNIKPELQKLGLMK